jgi:hypothetical protein
MQKMNRLFGPVKFFINQSIFAANAGIPDRLMTAGEVGVANRRASVSQRKG